LREGRCINPKCQKKNFVNTLHIAPLIVTLMTSKLRNYEDRVNKNRFDEAGLIHAGNFKFS